MTTPVDPTTGQQSGASPRRTRTAGHIVAIVLGCVMLVPGLSMVAGGGVVAVGQAIATDEDGYFRFTFDGVESTGVAIATTDLWLDDVEGDASPWLLDWLDLDLRLRVDGAGSNGDIFVGIARSADVERYLSETTFSEIVEIDERTPRYREVEGTSSVDPPTDQDFWTVSASGPGEQELLWNARGGRWSVAVMNADGSPLVSADVEVGARSGVVTPIAMFLLVIGGAITLAAAVMIVLGARGRQLPETDSSHVPFDPAPLPPPTPENAGLSRGEERRATPIG